MEKPSTAKIALKWGLISAIIIVVYTIIYYMLTLFKSPLASWIPFIILIFGIFLAMKEFKEINSFSLKFGEGVNLGALVSAVAGIIASIFTYIYTHFVDTTIMQQMSDLQREEMEARGLSGEQIEQAMQMVSKFTTPGLVFLFGVLFYLFFGVIFSLILAAILKKNPPVEF